jgi:glycine oxidase
VVACPDALAPSGRRDNDWKKFDLVIDCRGMGAKEDLRDLRGVRGELLYLHAPEVNLSRPVRIMHPRFSIYIVPRADHVYVVGATAIESDDAGAITVRSALELLSAAYTVHSGFAEGRLIETSVSCRPGFPDNHPRILIDDGHIAINGLYRHGFLISPALVAFVASYLDDGSVNPLMQPLMKTFSP